MSVQKQEKKNLYYSMLRIRLLQERIDAEYLQDNMKTPVHLCIGQEAIAVGACYPLRTTDLISSNHRGHGHYLAKGGNMDSLVAELHCKKTGCSHAFGGSMHIIDTTIGHLGSSSIVGGGIPIGTGFGLALSLRKEDGVSVVFFGDGASEEGTLYESIHFAVLKKLPVIFVLENNGYAVCSPLAHRQNAPSIFHTGYATNALFSQLVDGNDVEAVYNAMQHAIQRAREGAGPSFIECTTYRIPGHAGCFAQDAKGYRDEAEIAAWKEKCPLALYEKKLLDQEIISQLDIEAMKAEIAFEINNAFTRAYAAPLPDTREAVGTVYCE